MCFFSPQISPQIIFLAHRQSRRKVGEMIFLLKFLLKITKGRKALIQACSDNL